MNRTFTTAIAALCLAIAPMAISHADTTKKATLPFVLFGNGSQTGPNYYASGWMGNTGAIKMDGKSTDNPHSGSTCMKFDYTANDNWAGVVWQNPANNWGEQAGGFDLTGAKKLTFWARGANGGEAVEFSFGLVGKDKPNGDSGSGKTGKTTLTKEWKEYTIDLAGKDLSHIITGFCWVVAGSGSPMTFYVDDAKFE